MANGVVEDGENAETMFSEEEVREMSGMKKGKDHIEVMCGCTSRRYGDAVARLRVFRNGDLEISCDCTPGCQEDMLTPAAFEKHSGRESARKWKNNIWIIWNGDKVPLFKTPLLKYYNQAMKSSNGSNRSSSRVFHRDEFIQCSTCGKDRRFRLRTKDECRFHHDASLDEDWECSDHPYDRKAGMFIRISYEDEEETTSKKVYKGCLQSPTCKGCTSCFCFGCNLCRCSDCNCQTCASFTTNAGA